MSAPLRIVQIVPSLVLGGAETFALALAAAQAEAGHDVTLVALRPGDGLADRLPDSLRGRYVELDKRGPLDARILPRLAARLRAAAPDVVHTHLFTGLAWGTTAARLAAGRTGSRPVVLYTEHACHPDDVAALVHVRRRLSPWVDAVVGCSPAATLAVLSRDEAPHSLVTTIANGIPLDGRLRASLAGQGPLHLGTVGRLVPIKGQRFLIEAVGLLRDRGVDVRCTILGEGELRGELEAQVARLGLSERVALPGATSDVPGWMARFDLFVLPSLSEAMPMTLLEAAAAGLPLLVTTGGGGPTLLAEGAGGEAVPPGEARALADAIGRHAALPVEARRALGAASLEVAREHGIARCAERYVALARQLGAGAARAADRGYVAADGVGATWRSRTTSRQR